MEHASRAEEALHRCEEQSSSADDFAQGSVSAEAAGLIEDVRRAIGRNPDDARAAALRLVTLLTSGPPAGLRGGLAPWQRRKIERYMGERLEHPLPVRELAEQIPLSVSHFCRAFKESYGTTPHTHITRLRVELAQRLLLTTSEPLSQIALACGLADQAHLSKLFRRCVGETPTAWRRRNLTEAQAETQGRRPTGGCAAGSRAAA
jgi:AraC family transcriptional regulator